MVRLARAVASGVVCVCAMLAALFASQMHVDMKTEFQNVRGPVFLLP